MGIIILFEIGNVGIIFIIASQLRICSKCGKILENQEKNFYDRYAFIWEYR